MTSIPPPHLSSHRSSFSSAGCSSTQVVAQEGSATLFYGLTPTLIRSLPNLGIQFLLYEMIKRALGFS